MALVLLEWPTTQDNYGHVTHLNAEGQLRVAKERVAHYLKHMAPRDGEAITIAFKFGGFVPH